LAEAGLSAVALLVLLAALPFGIRVVAIASAAAMFLLTPLAMLWASRWLPLSPGEQLKPFRLPAAGAVFLLVITLALNLGFRPAFSPPLRLVLTAAAAAVVLFACYRWMGDRLTKI
jgi:hypothetical protein